MNIGELRKNTKTELISLLVDLSKEQFSLKMQKGTNQLSRPDKVKKVRRDIARIQTILNEVSGK